MTTTQSPIALRRQERTVRERIADALIQGQSKDVATLRNERRAIREELEDLFAALPYLEDEARAAGKGRM